MFNPSKDEVRQFFCNTWQKSMQGEVLTPLEAIASDWIRQHPEYENELADSERALETDYSIDQGRSNPFLHLSMHLSIHEQISVDQPPGIRDACAALVKRLGSVHDAHHMIMECLGEMLWTAQRNSTPPDGEAYIHCIRQRAGQ
ncbi:MAG: DUF1841 family protein [Betaproteobacteria bacterium]|nr:DUF1841 family protein [Betaproteobacteria bacterium]